MAEHKEGVRATLVVIDNVLEANRAERTVTPITIGRTIREVLPERITPDGTWIVIENGRVLEPAEWQARLITPGTELICYPRMSGAVGRTIAGGLLIVAGILAMELPVVGVMLISMGVGLMAGGVMELVMGAPSMAAVPQLSNGDQSTSPTYGFAGIQNSTRVGAPIPVVYGRHRIVAAADHLGPCLAVMDGDKVLPLKAICELATTTVQLAAARYFSFVVCDASPKRDGSPGLDPAALRFPPDGTGLDVYFANIRPPVARIEHCCVLSPERAKKEYGLTGHAMIAVARLNDTALAEAVWGGIDERLIDGCCVVVLERRTEDGRFVDGEVQHVIIGDAGNTCLPSARILRHWEGQTSM